MLLVIFAMLAGMVYAQSKARGVKVKFYAAGTTNHLCTQILPLFNYR